MSFICSVNVVCDDENVACDNMNVSSSADVNRKQKRAHDALSKLWHCVGSPGR